MIPRCDATYSEDCRTYFRCMREVHSHKDHWTLVDGQGRAWNSAGATDGRRRCPSPTGVLAVPYMPPRRAPRRARPTTRRAKTRST